MIKINPGNVTATLSIQNRALKIQPDGKQPAYVVCDNLDELADLLRSLADQLVTERADQVKTGVTKNAHHPWELTPLQVIEYFYNSEDLREHAADVEEVLSKFIPGYNRQLIADMKMVNPDVLMVDGKPVVGIQSRIAEALNITNAGQANRKRILAVFTELTNKYSTTIPKAA